MRVVMRLAVCVTILIALVACGGGAPKGVVGKWKITKMTIGGQDSALSPNGDLVFDFFDDGSYTFGSTSSTSGYKGTYTYRENGQLTTIDQKGQVQAYNAVLDGNTLTLTLHDTVNVLERQ